MSSKRSDGELMLECKAAFLCIYDDIEDKIESKKSLNSLLQQTGRNPTKGALAKYWPANTEELSFNDFVDICRKEAVTSADDLMKAFRKIDINGDGYISLDELFKIMSKDSDDSPTRDDVRKMIDEVDENKDGKLDYREFTNMVMKTAEDAKKFSMKMMERKERKKRSGGRGKGSGSETPKQRPGSASSQRSQKLEEQSDNNMGSQSSIRSDDVPRPSPRVRSGSKSKSLSARSKESLPNPNTLTDWCHRTSKGCFFYEEDEINTHVYSLSLQETSNVYFSAHPIQQPACLSLPSSEPVDTALFILNERGRLVTYTEQRDTSGLYGVKCKLTAGEYQILPYTTGCRFRQRKEGSTQHMKEAKLVKKDKEDNIKITSAFRKALEDIFELCDLDDNGTMSKDEFNWFNLRTSGEELGEDEWEVVEERTELKNGEITKAGFIALNEMEAEDAGGDVEDLWITLSSMGMNKSLIMDEACPFRLDVYVEKYGSQKPTLSVTGIESLEKKDYVSEICASIKETGEPTKIKGMKDLYLYTFKSEQRATLVIDNRSRSAVNVAIDCSKSKNVTSNRESLSHVFEIDPQETAIAHHLLPRDELSDWSVTSVESIQQ